MAASSDSPDLSMVSPTTEEAASDAIERGTAPSAAAMPASVPEQPARRSRWAMWLLGLALVAALFFAFSQGQRADELSAQVAGLEVELSQVGAQLEAHQVHLGRVRASLGELSGRVLALRELANMAPGSPQAAPEAIETEQSAESASTAGLEAPPGAGDF